jgi:hypothetical protein
MFLIRSSKVERLQEETMAAHIQKKSSSRWWLLYLLAPLAAGLMVLDDELSLPTLWRRLLLIAIVGLVYWLVSRWIAGNERVLEREGVDAKPLTDAFVSANLHHRTARPSRTLYGSEHESAPIRHDDQD